MFRSALFLILMLLVSTTVLTAGLSGSRHSAQPVLMQDTAFVADTGKSHAAQPACDLGTEACSSCKLCHVCLHVAVMPGAALAAAGPAFHTQPAHHATTWLSAEHPPDFRPPIL